MKHNSETILTDNGIELSVSYKFEQGEALIEEGHGFHEVGKSVNTQLISVNIEFDGGVIDVLPLLNNYNESCILYKLKYL